MRVFIFEKQQQLIVIQGVPQSKNVATARICKTQPVSMVIGLLKIKLVDIRVLNSKVLHSAIIIRLIISSQIICEMLKRFLMCVREIIKKKKF